MNMMHLILQVKKFIHRGSLQDGETLKLDRRIIPFIVYISIRCEGEDFARFALGRNRSIIDANFTWQEIVKL